MSHLGEMGILWLKLAAIASSAAICLLGLAVVGRLPPTSLLRWRRWDVALGWATFRLLPIVVVYGLAGFRPESDVATCFWPQASGAVAGALPYRDFESFFGPLFPHLLAVPLLLWHDPRAIIVWFGVLEAATIGLTARAAGMGAAGPRRARFLLCAFAAPGPLMLGVIGGQEDFLLWSFGLIAWLALRDGRETRSVLYCAAAMLATKAVFLLPLAAFVGAARRRLPFLGWLAAVGGASAGFLWMVTGTGFLSVLGQSGNISPPQIWLLLHLVTGGFVPAGAPVISFLVVALLLLLALVYAWRRAAALRASAAIFMGVWCVGFILLIVLSPKSQGAYYGYLFLPLLALISEEPRWLAAWLVVGAGAAFLPSLFYRLGEPQPASVSELAGGWELANVLLQFAVVGGTLALGFRAAAVRQDSP